MKVPQERNESKTNLDIIDAQDYPLPGAHDDVKAEVLCRLREHGRALLVALLVKLLWHRLGVLVILENLQQRKGSEKPLLARRQLRGKRWDVF